VRKEPVAIQARRREPDNAANSRENFGHGASRFVKMRMLRTTPATEMIFRPGTIAARADYGNVPPAGTLTRSRSWKLEIGTGPGATFPAVRAFFVLLSTSSNGAQWIERETAGAVQPDGRRARHEVGGSIPPV
jgi:hypothetical protein